MEQKEIDRFDCQDEEGNIYTVIQWTKISVFKPIREKQSKGEGQTRYALTSGDGVEYVDEEQFMIFDTGLLIRKV
ncbi:MAG: hypothetical protein ABJO30_04930 [Hyphomicrobiales bacterium]